MKSSIFREVMLCKGNTKGAIFIICFRISNFFTKNIFTKIIGFPFRIAYKFFFVWLFSIDISDSTKIGYGLNIFHGHGLVINPDTIIGNNVILRQNTTIGNAHQGGGSPIIEDNVEVGANSVIIGEIRIGSNSIIAAGSIVVKSVPKNTVVAGNPAKIIKTL